MSEQSGEGRGPWANVPAAPNSMPETISSMQQTESPSMGEDDYGAVYPEVYYKLRPYIMMACDRMDSYGDYMPTQRQVEQMTDSIYDDACKMYPEMGEYLRNYNPDKKDDPPGDPPFPRFRPGFGFRRRGLARDFIEALLLAELFSRRGYYYY